MSGHIGRSWNGTKIEDGCLCGKAPCGLVDDSKLDPDCGEHSWTAGHTIRQGHLAHQCPAIKEAEQ